MRLSIAALFFLGLGADTEVFSAPEMVLRDSRERLRTSSPFALSTLGWALRFVEKPLMLEPLGEDSAELEHDVPPEGE